MKVCMLTTSFPAFRGDIRSPFLLELCDALSKEGVTIDVICPRYMGTEGEAAIGTIRIHRFSYFFPRRWQVLTSGGGIPSALKRSWLARIQFPFFFLAFLLRSLRYGKQCDVIHCQWSFSGLVGIALKWLYGKPLVMTERGASANLAMGNWLMRNVLRFLAYRCDFITANSVQQTELFYQLGVQRDRIVTVLNGIDTDMFMPHDKKKCRDLLGLPQDKKIILFVGWLIQRKGIEYLLEAVAFLSQERDDFVCVIVGEGDQEKRLQKLVADRGLESFVSFVGAVPHSRVPLYMSAADAFVLPSLSEGKPNVVGEAMACGVPVIATAVAGTNEILRDRVNGFAVRPQNPQEITACLKNIFSNPRRAQSLALQARTMILQNGLTWKACARQYLHIYNKVL